MPNIGDIAIPEHGCGKHIWLACETCGLERWVSPTCKGHRQARRCRACANRTPERREQNRGVDHSGEKNANWKGGQCYEHGYILCFIRSGDSFFYPMGNKDHYVLEHRLIMAKHLGRNLHSWEIVHHLNGKRADNQLSNLQLVMADTHNAMTLLTNRVRVLEKRLTAMEAENTLLKAQLATSEVQHG